MIGGMNRRSRAAAASLIVAVAASVSVAGASSASGPATAAFVVPPSRPRRSCGSPSAAAFRPRSEGEPSKSSTSLRDINEWRDVPFDYVAADKNPSTLGMESDAAPPREVCVLPFPYADVLLQGETKELRLYEERFLRLFDDAMEHHGGVVAMGLLAESGIVQTVPLCEIEAFNRMEGFGVFLTIRAVGRAQLVELTQQEPYIKAVCTEITDAVPPNLELPTIVAGNIENFMVGISALEHRLENHGGGGSGGKGNGEMEDRIARAELEDAFYSDSGEASKLRGKADAPSNGEEDDEDDDDDDEPLDRTARFRRAYEAACAADSQGYTVSPSSETGVRSARDLTALSWAAFCSDPPMDTHGELPVRYVLIDEDGNEVDADELEDEDGEALMMGLGAKEVTYKIQALDSADLFERLKLASFMLRERKALLRDRLERRGLGRKGGGEEGESYDEEL